MYKNVVRYQQNNQYTICLYDKQVKKKHVQGFEAESFIRVLGLGHLSRY